MSRWLAGTFAVLAVVGSALAVWLIVIEGDDDGASGRNTAQAATTREPVADKDRDAAARRGRDNATHFKVSVSGDLLMHQPLLDQALANGGGGNYDFAPFFRQIKPYIEGVDYALCHMETVMGPGPPATYPIFNTPTDLADSLRRSGWDACSTASNHSLDQGQAGIDGTVKALHRADLEHTGSFDSRKASNKPTILNVDGVKIGFVSYTDATNGLVAPNSWSLNEYSADNPKAGAKAIIRDARDARDAGADAVIAQIHWGDEYAQSPNNSQLAVAKKLTDAKVVTVVVGQGPHVVQPIERLNGKFVVFSEGNLVSNQGAGAGTPTATQDGFVGLLHFKAKGERVTVRRVTYVPTWVDRDDYVVVPVNASSASYRRTVSVVGKGEGFGPER